MLGLTRFCGITAVLACSLLAVPDTAVACTAAGEVRESTSASVRAFVMRKKVKVLTFAGYSGAEYQDPTSMLEHASRVLDRQDPSRTVINIGATPEGIGKVYELAKGKDFTTMGIVSTLARDEQVSLSPCVDYVFFIKDGTWGGLLPGGTRLSPTSAAIVANSSSFVAIGGGEIARDEMLAARRAGKPVTFIPADMNHQIAREKARKRGLPEPEDFRGPAHVAVGKGT